MMYFQNFRLTGDAQVMQYDNLRVLPIAGNFPEGWKWDLLISYGENKATLTMYPTEQGIERILSREHLCFAGEYKVQLRGTKGEEVRHTNQGKLIVGQSIDGEGSWPDSPGSGYKIGHGLKVVDDTLEVDAVDNFQGDNTLPITAAAVQASIGNIELVLATI